MRHRHARGAEAVGVDAAHVAAERVEEAMHLALRVMEAPGARPAVGPAEDRRVAVRVNHALEFAGQTLRRLFPVELDEGVRAAPLACRARPMLEPALAECR